MFTPMHSARGTRQLMPACPPLRGTSNEEILLRAKVLPTTRSHLVRQTLASILAELQGRGQSVPDPMEQGLHDLADVLWQMAEGALPKLPHLSSLDPGVGKTTTVRHFLKVLVSSNHHQDVSALVCLSRLEEIKKMAKGLSKLGVEVGVLTKDDETNAVAKAQPQQARVLLTTQQMIIARCRHQGRFRDTEAFHHEGRVRSVRIWDEAYLPGEVVSLTANNLANLIDPLGVENSEVAAGVEALRNGLSEARPGKRFWVPAADDLGQGAALALRQLVKNHSSYVANAARDLLHMAGQALPVHETKTGDKLLLDNRDTIPGDLAPIVLDASGRCRHTYRLMEQAETLVRLPPVAKDYSNLDIQHWAISGGKGAFQKDDKQVRLRGIAETILDHPDEDWLVVHHKDTKALPFSAELLGLLQGKMRGRVHFRHWGDHHGTNAFADVRNVILAGTLFLPDTEYEGRARLSAGLANDDKVGRDMLRALKRGEHADLILQALCRASVRGMTSSGSCKPCRAYVIASHASGIPKLLPELFPGCSVEEWFPLPGRITPTMQRAIAVIDEAFRDGLCEELTFAEIRQALGIRDKSNFRRTVVKKQEFRQALEDRDLKMVDDIEVEGRTHSGIRPWVSVFSDEDLDD